MLVQKGEASGRLCLSGSQDAASVVDLRHTLSTKELYQPKYSRRTKQFVQRQDETGEVIPAAQTPHSTSIDVERTK
jgi:hypothetical protein